MGESPFECAVRELYEETGIQMRSEDFLSEEKNRLIQLIFSFK
jgi:8-oxo-dGTP pyrophosphatase MutT (NUDIX family)